MMKRVGFLASALLACAPALALAQSAKATAAINTAVGCTVASASDIGDTLPIDGHDIFSGAATQVTADNFAVIMSSTIKVSNSQSLFASPSLVTGLYTQTKTKGSSGGSTSTAVAAGGVYLRAVIRSQVTGDRQVAYPVAVCTPVRQLQTALGARRRNTTAPAR